MPFDPASRFSSSPNENDPIPSPTPQQQRILDAASSPPGADDLAFLARIVVQASFPYRDPGDCTFVRRNGDYTLTLQAPPDVGLPYGRYPRLVLAHLCREALRTRSRELYLGDTMTAFMRAVGLPPSGGQDGPLGRFRRQVARLFSTTISCSWAGKLGGTYVRTEMGTRIASRSVVWWAADGEEGSQSLLDGGWLTLSPDFYQELVDHPVPLDRRVLLGLTSSFALDLYAWTTYRMSRLHRPVSIRWPELAQQFGTQQRALRNFRIRTRRALERIRVFYPRLRFEVTREALRLYPSGTHVRPGAGR